MWQSSEAQALRRRHQALQRERLESGASGRERSSGRSSSSSSSSGRGGRGGGREAEEEDGSEREAELGPEIKRVCYAEACYLLSPPEASLLLCWLGDDARPLPTKQAELAAALQQVEAWAAPLLQLLATPPFSDQRSMVMSVVKTAHWYLVKLWEAQGEYAKALAAQATLKASSLVECQPEELRIVEAAARQYRWTELKERGEVFSSFLLFYIKFFFVCFSLLLFVFF
jgi:hypothetical protein